MSMYCYSFIFIENNKIAGNPIAQTVSNDSTRSVFQGVLCSSAVRVFELNSLCFQLNFKGEHTGHAGLRFTGFLVVQTDSDISSIRVDVFHRTKAACNTSVCLESFEEGCFITDMKSGQNQCFAPDHQFRVAGQLLLQCRLTIGGGLNIR